MLLATTAAPSSSIIAKSGHRSNSGNAGRGGASCGPMPPNGAQMPPPQPVGPQPDGTVVADVLSSSVVLLYHHSLSCVARLPNCFPEYAAWTLYAWTRPNILLFTNACVQSSNVSLSRMIFHVLSSF
ncbi:hypothetical protein QR680_001722 [Steinernema hermaphroditum]|uniref:Uncharacterized protein n=1 Tax=Steinernema hermaphroditum TaxID=289476 RepID=A0AA39LGK3_9BILA|nr:hypothetical protein QR680_001722 [Steinernema hermaphroditum]